MAQKKSDKGTKYKKNRSGRKKKKSGAKKKVEKKVILGKFPRTPATVFLVFFILAIAILIVFLIYKEDGKTETEVVKQAKPKAVHKTVVVLPEPQDSSITHVNLGLAGTAKLEEIPDITLEEAEAFYYDVLIPTQKNIYYNYPIKPIQQKFVQVMEDIRHGRIERMAIRNAKTYGLATSDVSPDGKPAIAYHLKMLKWIHEDLNHDFSEEKASMIFEDLIVTSTLHEYYHLTVQEIWKKPDMSTEEGFLYEPACWAYMCENVIQVIIDVGRPRLENSSEDTFNRFYHQNNLHAEHPIWVAYLKQAHEILVRD